MSKIFYRNKFDLTGSLKRIQQLDLLHTSLIEPHIKCTFFGIVLTLAESTSKQNDVQCLLH